MTPDENWLIAAPTAPDVVGPLYDDWVATYDSTLESWGYEAPARVASLLLDGLDGHDESSSILDAGCGTGLVGDALRAAGYRGSLTGIDLSPASIAAAAERGVYDQVAVANMQKPLSFQGNVFDAVTCVGVLTYLPDTFGIWSEFARVVRPAGLVVCTQRDDIWLDRNCMAIAGDLERAGIWTVHHVSPPRRYMPGNPDFTDRINVRYLTTLVR